MGIDNQMKEVFLEFMNEQEIGAITATKMRDFLHPVRALLIADNGRSNAVKFNTRNAIENVSNKDRHWLNSVKPRLLQTGDYSDAASALAEIRAYGSLLSAGIPVKPVATKRRKPSPDFAISRKPRDILIEVHIKMLDGDTAAELRRFHTEPFTFKEGEHVAVRETSVSPFGKPDKGEYALENAISRVSSIKEDERQFGKSDFNILWIDFQHESWYFEGPLAAMPLYNADLGNYLSGYVWYAFYGIEGLPMFELASFEKKALRQGKGLAHNGRYFRKTNGEFESIVDLAVVSWGRKSILLENPNRGQQLTDGTWCKLMQTPHLDYASSWIDWPEKFLEERIALTHKMLFELNRIGLWSW